MADKSKYGNEVDILLGKYVEEATNQKKLSFEKRLKTYDKNNKNGIFDEDAIKLYQDHIDGKIVAPEEMVRYGELQSNNKQYFIDVSDLKNRINILHNKIKDNKIDFYEKDSNKMTKEYKEINRLNDTLNEVLKYPPQSSYEYFYGKAK